MKNYIITESTSRSSLEEKIGELIEDGYVPSGSLVVYSKINIHGNRDIHVPLYVQSMIHSSVVGIV